MGSQPTKLWSGFHGIGGDTVEDVVEDVIYYVVDEEMKRLRREELTYELAHAQEQLKCAEKASELAESEFFELHRDYNHGSATQEEKDAYNAAGFKSRDTGSEIVGLEIQIADIKIELDSLNKCPLETLSIFFG
jgi:hypothetical protein